MNIKIFFLLAIFISFISCKQEYKNDLDTLNITNSVKSIKELSFTVKNDFGKISKAEPTEYYNEHNSSYSNKIISFNKNGYVIKKSFFDDQGSIKEVEKFSLDETNRKIKFEQYGNEGNRTALNLHNYQNDSEVPKSIENYDRNGELEFIWKFRYNENLNEIERYVEYPDGQVPQRWFTTYNDRGKTKSITEIRDSSEGFKEILYYNDTDLLIKKKNYFEQEPQYVWIYTYDENDNISSCKKKSQGSNEIEYMDYKYTYDDENNWIEKVVYINEIPKFIIEREYQYY
ncbi:hypothetical protein [Croceibacter atlanticus]|uniref:hypothetical protein n=1 Tax=Croceibacter atlanticus TaxID=313588 RepID=UPI0030FA26DC